MKILFINFTYCLFFLWLFYATISPLHIRGATIDTCIFVTITFIFVKILFFLHTQKINKILLTVSTIFVITTFIFGYMNYNGFCWKKVCYLSNKIKKDIAFEYAINVALKGISYQLDDQWIEQLPYKNSIDFLNINPDWYAISRDRFKENIPPSFINKIRGEYSYGVWIKMKRIILYRHISNKERIGTGQKKEIETLEFLKFGNCGEIYKTCFNY